MGKRVLKKVTAGFVFVIMLAMCLAKPQQIQAKKELD